MRLMPTSQFSMTRAFPNFFKTGDAACAEAVLKAYSEAHRPKAFDAAVAEWRKHNPAEPPHAAAIAVATIISTKN